MRVYVLAKARRAKASEAIVVAAPGIGRVWRGEPLQAVRGHGVAGGGGPRGRAGHCRSMIDEPALHSFVGSTLRVGDGGGARLPW